ncbi:hypothetical protein NliqN6_4722 [Naganishia liquefaciens]|uniref:Transmembrane protein n=1 Tax=Naganishia liquefaciens TaxID=104408 RepID=A0A8H3TWY4_9TREE|nr:hypothetical protein NliqN6_4722 [Naganishia liquefaciens]
MSRSRTSWSVFLILWSTLALSAFANTEIINFRTTPGSSVSRHKSLQKNVVENVLIPGQSHRISIAGADFASADGQAATVTREFRVLLDEYVKNQTDSDVRLWSCQAFLGGCDATADQAWTARISWPATTPADFKLAVGGVADAKTGGGHDRIIRVQVDRTGITVPPSGPLRMLSRQLDSESPLIPAGDAVEAASLPIVADAAEEDLVFDLVIEPLLFGVLPLKSLQTAVAVIVVAVMGSLMMSVLFNHVPM